MIRRRVGDEFWLFTQHDHALLSGKFAQHFGNEEYARPEPFESVVRGVSQHDCGWPLHDDAPTLNRERVPLDVFETTPSIGPRVWNDAAKRCALTDPYAALLVSLHALWLSVFATGGSPVTNEKFDIADPRIRFEVNKFQHAQIELQERLRAQVGLRTDIPLRHGLAENSNDPGELNLRFNFRLLQAMDKLSLDVCCTKPPFEKIEPLEVQPGVVGQPLSVRRIEPGTLNVTPWPFDVGLIAAEVPFRRLRAEPFPDELEFRRAYAAAPVEKFAVQLVRG